MDNTYVYKIKSGLNDLKNLYCKHIFEREKIDNSNFPLFLHLSSFNVEAFDYYLRFSCSSFSYDFSYECSFSLVYAVCSGFVIANCESCFHRFL